jgi:hypothetical protein
MIVRILLIIALCLQAQSVFPMMEPIEKDKQHVAEQADDLSAMDTNDVPSIGELYAMQNREKVTQKEKEERAIKEAMLLDAKKYPGIEIRTIMRDETREVIECIASILLGCNNYWSDPKSCDKVVFALKKLKNFGEPMPQRTWLSYRCQLFARARAALDDARICREQVLGAKRFVKSDKVESFTALEQAHFNLELLEQFDKYIKEKVKKQHGKEK